MYFDVSDLNIKSFFWCYWHYLYVLDVII